MDKKTSLKSIIILHVACLLFILGLISGITFNNPALAAENVAVKEVTAINGYTVGEDGSIVYSRGTHDITKYGKDIEITFTAVGAASYRLDVTVEGSTIEGNLTAMSEEEVIYKVTQDGEVTVTFVAFNGERKEIGRAAKKLKSDVTEPNAPISVTKMSDWLKEGTSFDVTVDLTGFTDDLSGRKEIFYRYIKKGEIGGELSSVDLNTDSFSLTIDGNGKLYLYCFDNAYNSVVGEYEFAKFDSSAPPIPEITVTPNVNPESANGYVGSFTVAIKYYADPDSGLIDNPTYLINGRSEIYIEPFILNEAKNYEIKVNAVDKAGNISDTASVEIGFDRFDRTPPNVFSAETVIDITQENICTVRLVVNEYQSGIKRIYIDGLNVNFISGASNTYQAEFNCYNLTGFVVMAEDRVGNVSINHMVLNFFGDEEISDLAKKYWALYLGLDFSKYTDSSINAINNAYRNFNTLLISAQAQRGDFFNVTGTIDKLISGENKFVYKIISAPSVLSGLLTYKADISDFEGYVYGDEIKMELIGVPPTGNFVQQSGFKNGFSDSFTLRVFYNDEEVAELNNGIRVSLNMPVGYYGRQYALYDVNTGEKYDIFTVNNKIEFTLKKSATLELVISGERIKENEGNKKTINVFGNTLSYGVFFGTVFGSLGGVAIIVIILLVVRRKRNKRIY